MFNLQNENDHATRQLVENDRVCNIISTGAILLADVIPSMVIKAIAPFIPFYIQ